MSDMNGKRIDRKLAGKIGFSINGQLGLAVIYRWASYAAAIVLVLGGWGVYRWGIKERQPLAKPYAASYQVVAAPDRGIRKISLPDGTVVTLNFKSSIQYSSHFDGAERRVKLIGEGFFEVAKDSKHPFIVETARQTVVVTGTSFDVSDYALEPMQRVVVHSGSVIVNRNSRRIVVKQGQALQAIGDSIHAFKMDSQVFDRSLSWRRGFFNFDGMDIRSAMFRLAQFYNKDVQFSADLKRGALGSGDFQQDLPLRKLLDHLELPDLHFDINTDTIFVTR